MRLNLAAYEWQTLSGSPISFEEFKGQVLLIVNVASHCGFTPQYAGLQELQNRYHARGFSVLGFPCNQFGFQESGSAEAIQSFCQTTYAVDFPMFAKVKVNGSDAHPLFQDLKKAAPGFMGMGAIKWNFTKFLVDRGGIVRARFKPSHEPRDLAKEIEKLLEKAL